MTEVPVAVIILADGQFLVRYALRQLIERLHWQVPVLEARNETELLGLLSVHSHALVVLDYFQPGHFEIATIQKMAQSAPHTRLLVITADQQKENMFQLIEQGIHVILTKNCEESEILEAIKSAARMERFYCQKVIDFILEKTFPGAEESCGPARLSAREIEIVQLTAKGLVAKQIAEALNLSTHTVYTHRKNILQKLNVKNSSELVLFAVNKGWVERE